LAASQQLADLTPSDESAEEEVEAVTEATDEAAEEDPAAEARRLAAFWSDPDLRWLTGVHAYKDDSYFVQEGYEEALWWLLLPYLLKLGGEPLGNSALTEEIYGSLHASLEAAKSAGYSLNKLLEAIAAE